MRVDGPITLSTPFLVQPFGLFSHGDEDGRVLVNEMLSGGGMATLTLVTDPDFPEGWPLHWIVTRAEYNFESAEPVPEPAALLLVGAGVAGAAGRRWFRRRR